MAAPRTAQLAGTVYWNDGITLFTGYVLLGLAYPLTANTSSYPAVYRGATQVIKARLPQWVRIAITQGQYDLASKLFYNADIDPPNSQYVTYFYDPSNTRVGGPSTLFTISTPTYTPVVPSLTLPAVATIAPTPDS